MKNLNQLIAALIIELMIFIPLAAVAQDINVTAPTAADTTPPFINVTVPSYVTTNRIDITGTTEPMSTVYLYVNGVKQRKSTPNPQGTFNFPSVDLSPLVPANTLKFEAIDPANNINIKEFTVVVDLTPPELTVATELRPLTNTSTLLVQGVVSEVVKLDIILNNGSALSEENVSAFNQTVNLAEGNNLLEIIAADPANNTDEVTAEIYLDTQPPVITNLTPETGAFFYETHAQTDIEGDTEPYTKIEIFVETREADPITGNVTTKREKIASTTSDENGHFKLEDIDLFGTTVIPGFLTVGGEAAVPTQVPAGVEEAAVPPIEAERPPEVTPLNLVLVATDRMGHATELRLNYRIGTCYGGGIDWNIINLIEWQAPTSMSPERLEEGTEIISFMLNLSYQGAGQDPVIRNVRFDKACEGEIVKDNMYKYSCKILPSSPRIRKPNDAKTLWYIRYDLQKLEGLDEFTDDVWKDLTRQFKFPLKVKIEYTYKVLNPNTGKYEDRPGYQTKCMDIAFHVDTSRIDPRDVLPDWILYDLADGINETIKNLDKLIENIDKVVEYIAIACTSMFAVRIIMTIYRRWVSHSEYITDELLSKAGTLPPGKPPCPAPGAADLEKLAEKLKLKPTPTVPGILGNTQATEPVKKQLDELKQDDLPNNATPKKYLQSVLYNLQTACPRTYAAWQSEAKVYQAYRWACDRFLCRGSPALWTGGNTSFEEIRVKTEKAAACTQETSSQGIILRKLPANMECIDSKEAKTYGNDKCWMYKGAIYAYQNGTGDDVVLKRISGVEGPIPPKDTPETLDVSAASGNVLLKEQQKSCNDLCKDLKKKVKYDEGKCLIPSQVNAERTRGGKTVKTVHLAPQKANCPKSTTCWCLKNLTTLKEPPDPDKWDYRYNKLNYYYDPYRYYEGRDKSACFGQNSWLQKDAPYLNVQNTWPAFQCLCIPQIRNRFVLFKNILSGMHNCLMQIRTTGRADTGVCKEMFTQYICKLMYRVISYFIQGCTPWTGGGDDPDKVLGERIRGGMGAVFGGVQEATNELFEDYDNAALRDYLGVGEGAIAEKVCLGALTGDWGIDLEGFIDAAYSQPYHSSASAWPADREYLTWDPDNEQATYEYRVAWMITPGCDINRYTISLSCASDFELYNFDGVECEQARNPNADEDDNSNSGCDCTSDAGAGAATRVTQSVPGPSRVIYTGGALKQGSFESRSVHSVQTGFQRYDNVKITLFVNDPKVAEQCIPPGHLFGRTGVFYSPISDATTYDIVACRFDQTQGYFRCDQGRLLWNLRGRAYFGRVKCDNTPCDEKTYYVDESIKLNPFEVYVQGQKQCLFIQLFNGKGQKLLEQEGRFIGLEPAEDDPTKTILVQKLNELDVLGGGKTITKEDFGKVPAQWDAKPLGSNAKYIREDRITDRQEIWVDVRDTSPIPDGKADQFRLQGGTWEDWDANREVPIGGMYFKFIRQPDVPKEVDETQPCYESLDPKPCRRYTFTIIPPRAEETTQQQDWTLVLELRHAPGNRSQGSCTESRREDIITYQGVRQEKAIKIKVKPKTKAQDQACTTGGFYKNQLLCQCDTDPELGSANDCDGETKFYCKDKKCFANPACQPSKTKNLDKCDCNWDGKLGDKNEKTCEDKYCWDDGTCHEFKQPLKPEEEAPTGPISLPVLYVIINKTDTGKRFYIDPSKDIPEGYGEVGPAFTQADVEGFEEYTS